MNDTIIPSAGVENGTGFFHERAKIGNMSEVYSAVMFDLPRSPLLSIAQFRHANLNHFLMVRPIFWVTLMHRHKSVAIKYGQDLIQ